MKNTKNKFSKTLKKMSLKKKQNEIFMGIFVVLWFFSGLFIWKWFFLEKVEIYTYSPEMPNIVQDIFNPLKLDFISDNSITNYVDANNSYTDKYYVPENLEYLQSAYVADSKWGQMVRSEANEALQSLAKQFYNTFWKKLLVVSAYRSYEYQVWIKNRGCPDSLCAKAGHSEHQSGLAIDLWETTTKEEFLSKEVLKRYYNWMKKNAHLYGFHNSYQKWIEIDTYHEEPWHWRYVWIDLASYLYSQNMTFAEYQAEIMEGK